MKIVVFCAAAGLAFHLPFAVFAQQSAATGTPTDTQYCRALAKAYNSMFPTNGTPSVNEAATTEQCGSNPQAAIPVLEKKLTDWKIELPYGARVAQPPAAGSKTR